MAMKESVSFKEKEKEIYDFLKSKLSPSIYIKELILKDMQENKEEVKPATAPVQSKKSISLDF